MIALFATSISVLALLQLTSPYVQKAVSLNRFQITVAGDLILKAWGRFTNTRYLSHVPLNWDYHNAGNIYGRKRIFVILMQSCCTLWERQVAVRTIYITIPDIQQRLKNMKSWKHLVRTWFIYWLKKLSALHDRLMTQMNQLTCGNFQPWLVNTGKDGIGHERQSHKGATPSNYRPITYLSTLWKFLSGIIAIKFYDHMSQYVSVFNKALGTTPEPPNISCS